LDLVSQERIRAFVSELNREEGCTVLLTSHYMRDVQELCQRVIVVGEGRIGYDGRLSDVAGQFGAQRRVRVTFDPAQELPDLGGLGTLVESDGHSVALAVRAADAPTVASTLLNQYSVADITIEDDPIEEVVKRLFRARPGPKPEEPGR
jgi:ABC-2 type transport system ATP-binding protein